MPRNWDLDSWMVFFWTRHRSEAPPADTFLEASVGNFEDWVTSRSRKHGQPFFIGPGVVVDVRINAYFNSPKRRRLSAGINKKAAYALRSWLEFLRKRGVPWDEATAQDMEDFAESKRYDDESPSHVQGNTWHGEIAQLKVFYRWAARVHGVADPITMSEREVDGATLEVADVDTHKNRQSDVKWLSPGAQARWRDVGILGVSLDGVEAASWRSRCEERDLAYIEGLYRTGLRMQEWASFLVLEFPRDDEDRWFYTLQLADACAKGGFGHRFWIDHIAVNHVRTYLEGERRTAVDAARSRGTYALLADKVIVEGTVEGASDIPRLRLRFPDGHMVQRVLNDLGPELRRRMFFETDEGLEPAMLWLNENGLPRPKVAWFKTVARINERVRAAGIRNLVCTQHMFRHSFALKWYTVGKLINEGRLARLSADEADDFRAEFGSTWHLVQTMLGHRNMETTKKVYLEPFLALSVEILLQHAMDDVSVRHILDAALRDHPSVISVEGATV